MLPYHKQRWVKRLLKLAAVTRDEVGDCVSETVAQRRRQRAVRTLLAALDQDSLRQLHDVIQSGGACQGACVLVPPGECQRRRKCAAGAVGLVCRHFRWPDLEPASRLKRLAVCGAGQQQRSVCVNPYHWSRLYRHDLAVSPCPAKLRCRLGASNSPGESETFDESVTTGGTRQYDSGGTRQYDSISSLDGDGFSTWCRLVYFERRRRVGQVGGWHVREPVQHVFHDVPHEDGLALDSLVGQNPQAEPDVLRTRQLIGKGASLSLEPDGVWLYNRSERPLFVSSVGEPLFVSSGTLEPAETVHRLPPGHSVLALERRRVLLSQPAHHATVTVSFAKGWGPKYSRRSAAECPCRMELWLCGAAVAAAAPGPPL